MKIYVYYRKCELFIFIVKSLWKTLYFVMLNYRGHEQLTPIYDNVVLEQAKNNYRNLVTIYLTYFPISQIVSRKGSLYIIQLPGWQRPIDFLLASLLREYYSPDNLPQRHPPSWTIGFSRSMLSKYS